MQLDTSDVVLQSAMPLQKMEHTAPCCVCRHQVASSSGEVEWDKVLEWRSYKGRSKEIYDCCKANKPHKDWEQVCGLLPCADAMDM